MPNSKSRARVERLLRGEIRADDLMNLFLFARDRCDGRESIKEIGDFVAHHAERTKGIITRTARDWFAIVRFTMPRFEPGGLSRLDSQALPAITPEFLNATLRRSNDEYLRKEAGLRLAQAHKILPEAIKGLTLNNDGTYAVPPTYDRKHANLLTALTSVIISCPAFTGKSLASDFLETLRSNGLVTRREIKEAHRLSEIIQLFAISIMHRCIIKMIDGSSIELSAGFAGGSDKLDVCAAIPMNTQGKGGRIRIASPMFCTDLDVIKHCEPEVIAAANHSPLIELLPNGKLGIFR